MAHDLYRSRWTAWLGTKWDALILDFTLPTHWYTREERPRKYHFNDGTYEWEWIPYTREHEYDYGIYWGIKPINGITEPSFFRSKLPGRD